MLLISAVAGGKELFRLTVPEGGLSVNALAFSGDGGVLASGDCCGNIHVWEAARGKERYSIKAGDGKVTGLAFSPDGRVLVSGNSSDKSVVWDLGSGLKRVELVKDWVDGSPYIDFISYLVA